MARPNIGAPHKLALPGSQRARIKALAAKHGVTFNTALRRVLELGLSRAKSTNLSTGKWRAIP